MNLLSKYLDTLRGKEIGIAGLGVSNRPLAKLLARHGANVTVYDKNTGIDPAPWDALGIRLTLGEDYLSSLRGDVVFRSPGIYPGADFDRVRAEGGTVTSEMELFFTLCPCRTIGVTGSDGKTTTTTMIANILREEGHTVWLGGNIGTPLLPELDAMNENDFAVAELSSFQLMDMEHSPQTAVITNLTPNHLDWHRDMAEYLAAKRRILDFQEPSGIAVLNAGDELVRELPVRGQRLLFGWDHLPDGKIGGFLPVSEILLPGWYNAEHYMAAELAVRPYVSQESVLRTARTFGGVTHRNQLVRELDGVQYYNDSIASSPSRTMASLSAHDRPVVLICGGKDKNLDYAPLAEVLPGKVKAVVLMGMTAGKIRAAAERVPGCPPLEDACTLEDAVARAWARAEPGDTVLLSPASTSFDMFKNFEERGEVFMELCSKL